MTKFYRSNLLKLSTRQISIMYENYFNYHIDYLHLFISLNQLRALMIEALIEGKEIKDSILYGF